MRVQVRDVRLFFDVEGTKLRPVGTSMQEVPTLLLLHGGPGFDHSEFKPGFSQLADIAQLIHLDHRGNGRSDSGPTDGWTLATWADDVREFCIEIDRPIVLGHSFGGIVAVFYATRYPDHPAKLILASTSVQPVGERSYSMFETLGGRAAKTAAVDFGRTRERTPPRNTTSFVCRSIVSVGFLTVFTPARFETPRCFRCSSSMS